MNTSEVSEGRGFRKTNLLSLSLKNKGVQSEWLRSKSLQVINAGEGVEKREPSYTVGGNAN